MSAATIQPASPAAPAAAWWPAAREHLRWRVRRARADAADLAGIAFTYPHPIAGRFVYHPGDYLSRRLYLYAFEEDELRFAVECARQGGIVLDVGANIGIFTAACARALGEAGRVVALEPGPAFAKLKTTCARLRLSNVEALAAAAGSARGTARLVASPSGRDVHHHLEDARAEPDGRGATVELVALDDLLGRDVAAVTLLKIDVEGHELGVLDGAARLLRNGRVALIVEVYAAALEAAGASVEALWRRLAATHVCVGVCAAGGSSRPPTLESVMAVEAGETVNTLWLPSRPA